MKILYLIHVCWEWIFQRPQILELLIEKDFDCTVLSKKFILGRRISKNNRIPSKLKRVYQLPKEEAFSVIKKINEVMYKRSLKKCYDYDAIWICHPALYEFVPKDYKGKIFYDCMDHHVAMAEQSQKERLNNMEQQLIERADAVIASSEYLIKNVPNMQKAILVRNGFVAESYKKVKEACAKETYRLGYFGTISSWFDFDLISDSLVGAGDIEYHLLGPVEKGIEEKMAEVSDKIHFEGVVEHSDLYECVKDYDALIMPFELNETILAVDPVKLYEYIYMGKCIISVWYPEIDRFSPFVYFYRSKEEYRQVLTELVENGFAPKYNEVQQQAFLKGNSWECRYQIVKEKLLKFTV